MRIQYASDLHLEFRENWRILREQGPMDVKGDILVLAGDIGYLGDANYSEHPFWDWVSENYQQVIVALGNHEFYKFYNLASMQDGLVGEIRPNVHYYYNKVVSIQDVDFIVRPFGLILTRLMPVSTSVVLPTFIGFCMARIC